MFFLFRVLALFFFVHPSFALYFQNQLGESQDKIDQDAQALSQNFSAVCVIKTFSKDPNADQEKVPTRSTNGVLFHVEKKKGKGYVLTYAKQFFQDDTPDTEKDTLMEQASQRNLVLWFGTEGKNSGPTKGPLISYDDLHFCEDETLSPRYTLAIIKFKLPQDFAIEPLPLYDGMGYKSGKNLSAILVSYGVFQQGRGKEKVDYIRRAGPTLVQFTEKKMGQGFKVDGLLQAGNIPAMPTCLGIEANKSLTLPFKQDGGSALIFKTSRGYQLAGIYSGLQRESPLNGYHFWYFVTHQKEWIDKVLTHQYNPAEEIQKI